MHLAALRSAARFLPSEGRARLMALEIEEILKEFGRRRYPVATRELAWVLAEAMRGDADQLQAQREVLESAEVEQGDSERAYQLLVS